MTRRVDSSHALRLRSLRSLLVAGLVLLLASGASAADLEERKASWEITEASRAAAARALAYLAGSQNANGSWTCDIGYKRDHSYAVTLADGNHVGVTALAGTAFLAGGHVPGRGKYSKSVEKALDYVLSRVGSDGYISSGGDVEGTEALVDLGTRMYSHAFATLFLAEIYGMSPRNDVRNKLQLAIDFTVRCQNSQGGWRYLPFDQFSDMSVTVCQIMALRAARNAGIRVPREHIDRAVKYVCASAVTMPSRPDRGSFRYIIHDPTQGRTSFALAAAGLTTIYGTGLYTDADIRRHLTKIGVELDHPVSISNSVNYIVRTYRNRSMLPRRHYFYFYGNYYAVQALFFRGGRDWREYYPMVRDELVSLQSVDDTDRSAPAGSWHSGVGPAFAAAVGAIILQVPYRYLPILQR
jgi:hypothetical protein